MICCIAGMHRSGTSLVAAWLHACGLTIADQAIMRPAPDNPRGYFEDLEFVSLHGASLLRYNRRSRDWRASPAQALSFSSGEVERAQRLIAVRRAKYSAWGWKDPRTTLFLPAWKRLLPELKVVLVWRPCQQVVLSLLLRWLRRKTRQHYPGLIGAIRLWQAHNRLACEFAEAHPQDTLVLTAAQIVEADQAVLALLNRRFDGSLVYIPVQTVYDSALLHHQPVSLPLRWLCAVAGCRQMEERLKELSISFGASSAD